MRWRLWQSCCRGCGINEGYRHPTSVVDDITIDVENTVDKNPSKTVHKTQKPVDLCEWLIKSYSNEGDVVMDFCMGSGTTGVACKNTKRKFIGVEMDKDIFEIAKERIR
jgi:DNA modification methylase